MDDSIVMALELDRALAARHNARRLAIFRGILADEVGACFLELLDALALGQESGRVDADQIAFAYARLFALLAAEAELNDRPLVGDAWQNHLLDRLLIDENPLSRKAQLAGVREVGSSLLAMARSELRALQSLHSLTAPRVCAAIHELLRSRDGKHAADWLIAWDKLRPLPLASPDPDPTVLELKRVFAKAEDWGALAELLVERYASAGAGIFARHRAFRWVSHDGRGRLEGIAAPDPIRLSQLIAYDAERRLLVRNTEQFLAGHPANNVLLYGDRGTGKSSTIKALLNEYGHRGLRLIEVPRHLLSDYHSICAELRGRPERFVLFVDDLSFDEHETGYKALKAILEGSLEARPDNVLLYATSNRRHLIQERFSDRQGAANSDEIHVQDTSQEKLSLSDRFGITITFLAPDQERYLEIVAGLAAQRGIDIGADELRARALAWAARHNGRSGRTARQFVDHLAGEMTS